MEFMLAMDYIRTRDLYHLLSDTLRLINPRPIDHGQRVAYLVYKMLQSGRTLEEFELADFIFLTTFHDFGAYKTDNLDDALKYENRDFMPHSIYGYLFAKNMFPQIDEEQAKVYLYHHIDYKQLSAMNFQFKELAGLLGIAEKMDLYNTALGEKFDYRMFQKYAGTKFSERSLNLFYQLEQKERVLEKLKDSSYQDELKEAVNFMIFTNEDKKQSLELLMYLFGFQNEVAVVNAVTCIYICRAVGKEMALSMREQEILYYGAMVHDIGMLSISNDIINAPRKLEPEEVKILRTHVDVSGELMKGRMNEEIIKIATAHHERCDGSGYPRGLKAAEMNTSQMILQVADTVSGLTNERSFRVPKTKEQVISILNEEAERGKFGKQVVKVFTEKYDTIMGTVKEQSNIVLAVYDRLNRNFKQVREQFSGKGGA